MPLPHWLARANRLALNRLLRRVAWWAPGFGVLVHQGRRSGRTFRTPLCVFRRGGGGDHEGYVIALTYGPETDWVKNVMAAGQGQLITRRRTVEVTNPRLRHDPRRVEMPPVVRTITGLIGVTEFLRVDLADPRDRTS